MRCSYLLFIVFICLLCTTHVTGQAFRMRPAHPHIGDTVRIQYLTTSADNKIDPSATDVRIVFTYSNLYGLPLNTAMEQLADKSWVKKFVIPSYGIYASFYLQAGDQKIQPSNNEQYEIMVYGTDNKPVKNALLYKSYSLSAQMKDRNKVKAAQRLLLERELKRYPDNYEAKLRLISHDMGMADDTLKEGFLAKGNAIIARQYQKTMPGMDALNKITMGYLILGENSRLDSIREVTMKKFPQAAVAKELLYGKIVAQKDTDAILKSVLQQVSKETSGNSEGMRDYHEWLFQYYAGKGQPVQALRQARRMLNGFTGPYLPVQMKTIAATLADHHLAADSAMVYAKNSLALLDSFPVGIMRYFGETGYIRPFVEDSVKVAELKKQKAILLSIMSQLEGNRKNETKASELAGQALSEDSNEEVLQRTATVYESIGKHQRAFDNYRQILLANPLDTTVIPAIKSAYIHWKGGEKGLSAALDKIYIERRAVRKENLEKTALQQRAPSLAGIVDMDGKSVDTASLHGKVLVIDFWATWCVPCMHEMPYLQKVYEKFKTDKRVAFMITNSGANNTMKDAQKWQKKITYTFPVYMHTNPNVGEVFGFNVIPALYVIDGNGNLQYKSIGFEGPSVEETLTLELELLLSKMK